MMRRLLILAAAALGACASPQPRPAWSGEAILLKLPFEAQVEPDLCGVAAVEMLTRYYGRPLNDAERQALREKAAKNKGLTGEELKRVLSEAGYFVVVFPGTMGSDKTGLYHQLAARRPVIVLLDGHYDLVRGYDPAKGLVVLSDPARGEVDLAVEDFSKSWVRSNRFTLLAVPEKTSSSENL